MTYEHVLYSCPRLLMISCTFFPFSCIFLLLPTSLFLSSLISLGIFYLLSHIYFYYYYYFFISFSLRFVFSNYISIVISNLPYCLLWFDYSVFCFSLFFFVTPFFHSFFYLSSLSSNFLHFCLRIFIAHYNLFIFSLCLHFISLPLFL